MSWMTRGQSSSPGRVKNFQFSRSSPASYLMGTREYISLQLKYELLAVMQCAESLGYEGLCRDIYVVCERTAQIITQHVTCTYTFVPKCILLSSPVHAQQETCWHTWRQCPQCVGPVSQKVPWSLLLPQKFGAVGGLTRLALSPGCTSAMRTLTHCLYVIFRLPFQFSECPPRITNQTVNISNSSGTHSVWDGLPAHLFKLSDELQYGQSRSQTKIIYLGEHKG